mgnify:CR=1 FL=1
MAAGLYLLINRTRIGMLIRAGASDREMVRCLGVRNASDYAQLSSELDQVTAKTQADEREEVVRHLIGKHLQFITLRLHLHLTPRRKRLNPQTLSKQ